MQDSKILRKNRDMVTRTIDKETILLPIYRISDDIDCIYSLNKPASRIWELIDGKRTLFEIKKNVLREFDATAKEVDKEMAGLLKDLKEVKAILG